MKFELIEVITSPFVLMFLAVITGILFGKIRFGKFNFGISGTLFTGLVFGWMATTIGKHVVSLGETAQGFKYAKEMMSSGIVSTEFFDFFLIIFVAAVGLLASKDMKAVLKKYGMRFVILGILITFTGGATTYALALISANSGNAKASAYEVSGVYTGALTSSPGLAAALETAGKKAAEIGEVYEKSTPEVQKQILKIVSPDQKLDPASVKALSPEQVQAFVDYAQSGVGIGHAVAYPFGVLIVILGVNFLPKLFRMNMDEEWARYNKEMAEARENVGGKEVATVPFSVLTFTLACFIGFLFGKIQVFLGPIGFFSLGSTGGVLIMALILGYLGKVGPFNFRMDPKVLTVLREYGLAFFLAIVGLRYGGKVVDALMTSGTHLVVAGLIVGTAALIVGFVLGRYVFKLNWILLSGAICGGMTSTPGLGAAVDSLKSDEPGAGYGATYPFALLTKVILVIVLHKLPLGLF